MPSLGARFRYNRGMWDRCLCSGSGCYIKWFCQKEEEIVVQLSGGDLVIRWAENDHIWMRGPAEFIADGIYEFLS